MDGPADLIGRPFLIVARRLARCSSAWTTAPDASLTLLLRPAQPPGVLPEAVHHVVSTGQNVSDQHFRICRE